MPCGGNLSDHAVHVEAFAGVASHRIPPAFTIDPLEIFVLPKNGAALTHRNLFHREEHGQIRCSLAVCLGVERAGLFNRRMRTSDIT